MEKVQTKQVQHQDHSPQPVQNFEITFISAKKCEKNNKYWEREWDNSNYQNEINDTQSLHYPGPQRAPRLVNVMFLRDENGMQAFCLFY